MSELIYRFLLLAAIALAFAPTGPVSAQATATANAVRQTAQDVLSQSRYQPPPEIRGLRGQSRDGFEAPKGPPTPDEIAPAVEPESPPAPPRRLRPISGPLLWMLIFIGGVLLAAYLWHNVPRLMGQRRQRPQPIPANEPASSVAPPVLTDDGLVAADRLAQQGQYGEAIHALLLHSFEKLHQRLRVTLIPSRTGREILRALALDSAAKIALTKLVGTSEHNHFGGRRSDEAEYRACRDECRRLLEITAGVSP